MKREAAAKRFEEQANGAWQDGRHVFNGENSGDPLPHLTLGSEYYTVRRALADANECRERGFIL